jgi:hypothetical protein
MNTNDLDTDDLIETMAQELQPVAPLPPHGKRAAAWLSGAALYVGALVFGLAWMNGIAGTAGAAFWWSQAAAVAVGVLAGAAAFESVVPGAASSLRWWAITAAVVWLGILAASLQGGVDWSAVAGANHEWLCVGFIVIGGAPLAAALVRMLRYGAPLAPATTAAYVVLAAASLAGVGACLALPHPNGAVTLVWHGGLTLLLVVAASAGGPLVFSWRSRRSAMRVAKAGRASRG